MLAARSFSQIIFRGADCTANPPQRRTIASTTRQHLRLAEDNSFETARAQFDRIADRLHLEAAAREFLRSPMREYHFAIPIRMDDGTKRVFRAVRLQPNDARGPRTLARTRSGMSDASIWTHLPASRTNSAASTESRPHHWATRCCPDRRGWNRQ